MSRKKGRVEVASDDDEPNELPETKFDYGEKFKYLVSDIMLSKVNSDYFAKLYDALLNFEKSAYKKTVTSFQNYLIGVQKMSDRSREEFFVNNKDSSSLNTLIKLSMYDEKKSELPDIKKGDTDDLLKSIVAYRKQIPSTGNSVNDRSKGYYFTTITSFFNVLLECFNYTIKVNDVLNDELKKKHVLYLMQRYLPLEPKIKFDATISEQIFPQKKYQENDYVSPDQSYLLSTAFAIYSNSIYSDDLLFRAIIGDDIKDTIFYSDRKSVLRQPTINPLYEIDGINRFIESKTKKKYDSKIESFNSAMDSSTNDDFVNTSLFKHALNILPFLLHHIDLCDEIYDDKYTIESDSTNVYLGNNLSGLFVRMKLLISGGKTPDTTDIKYVMILYAMSLYKWAFNERIMYKVTGSHHDKVVSGLKNIITKDYIQNVKWDEHILFHNFKKYVKSLDDVGIKDYSKDIDAIVDVYNKKERYKINGEYISFCDFDDVINTMKMVELLMDKIPKSKLGDYKEYNLKVLESILNEIKFIDISVVKNKF
jgi:hypothetical protein